MSSAQAKLLALGFSLFAVPSFIFLQLWPAGVYHHDSVAIINAVERWQQTGVLTGQIFGRVGSVIVAIISATVAVSTHLVSCLGCYSSAEAGTILGGVFAASLIPVLFFLNIRKLGFNEVSSYLAALLLATSPGLLLPSALGKEQSQSCLFLLLSWFVIETSEARGIGLALSAVAAAIAVSMHESTLLYLPFLALAWGIKGNRKWVDTAVWLSVIALSVLALLGWYLVPYLYQAIANPPSLGSVKLGLFSAAIPMLVDTVTLLNPLGIALLCTGVLYCAKREGDIRARSIVIFAASILLISCLSPYRFRYMIFTFVALYGFVAAGFQVYSKRFTVVRYGLFFGALILQLQTAIPALASRAQNPAVSIRSWSQQFAGLPPGRVIACDYQSFVEYYAKREVLPLCTAEDLPKLAPDDLTRLPLLLASSALNYDSGGGLKAELERLFEFKPLSARSHDSANGDGVAVRSYLDPIWLLLPRSDHQN